MNTSFSIRTYPANTDGSESTHSGSDAQVDIEEEDSEDTSSISTSDLLQRNQETMDQTINSPTGAWNLRPQSLLTENNVAVVRIHQPTASKMTHGYLNPYVYSSMGRISNMHELARLLNIPWNWESRYNLIAANEMILWNFNDFMALPEQTAESDIQFRFVLLVGQIALLLNIEIRGSPEYRMVVGGILARHQYDVRGLCDANFRNASNVHLIATECKTAKAFGMHKTWYKASRGVQVLSTLYALNCPTFLFTQQHWKMFVENGDRNAILTYPFNNNDSHAMEPMGTSFLKAIVICLLSTLKKAAKVDAFVDTVKAPTLDETNAASKKVVKKSSISDILTKTLQRFQKKPATAVEKVPSFASGLENGRPVYTMVRVLSAVEVAKVDDEISDEELLVKNLRQETFFN